MCHFNSNVIGQNESHGPQGAGKCKRTNGILGELTVSAIVGFRDSRAKTEESAFAQNRDQSNLGDLASRSFG